MATGLLAKKVGMTQIFTPEGDCVPVTVLEAGPCTVVRRKTADKDGYDAVVIGFETVDEKHARRLTKPEVGVFKKAGTPIFRHLREIRVKDAKLLGELKAGDVLTVDKVFKANQRIARKSLTSAASRPLDRVVSPVSARASKSATCTRRITDASARSKRLKARTSD